MKRLINILEYSIVILIVLNCRSVYQEATFINYRIKELLMIMIGTLLLVTIGTRRYDRQKIKKAMIYLIVYYMYIILFFLLNEIHAINDYIYTFGIMFPSLFFYYYINKDTQYAIIEVLRKLCNVMVFIATVSLFMYFIGPVLNLLKPSGILYINWGEIRAIKSYYGVQFVTQNSNIFGMQFIRNTSIFTEAPMYSLNLTIALAIELLILPKKNWYRKVILVVTILTTLSTTGIVLASAMIIISIFLSKQNSYLKQILKILTFPMIFIILIMVMYQFLGEKTKTTSWVTRFDDYVACYEAWRTNEIIGVGYGNENEIKQHMSSFRANNKGLSNSLLVVLAEGGIYLILFYSIPILKTMYYGLKYKKYYLIVFTLIITGLAMTTIFHFTAMMINLLAMGYAFTYKKDEKEKKDERGKKDEKIQLFDSRGTDYLDLYLHMKQIKEERNV